MGVCGPVSAGSVGLPEPGAKALSAMIGSKLPLVGISFGNPYLLQSFPDLRTYVVAYGDMPSLQTAAANALLGRIDVTGKLPISLPAFIRVDRDSAQARSVKLADPPEAGS